MKKINYFIVILALVSFVPAEFAKANIGIETEAEVRVLTPNENPINLRRLDLQKKLFQEKMEDHRANFQKAREDFKNSTPDTRNIMRTEFRAKFVERFDFAVEKLSDFQNRMSAKIEKDQSTGVNVLNSKLKLEESISFMAEIKLDIEKLKSILSERYAEEEREAKKEEVKVLVEEIKTGIKSSHKALKESFVELHKSKTQVRVETSTSAEININ